MIGAVLVPMVSGAKGRMECLDKCGVNGGGISDDLLQRLAVYRHTEYVLIPTIQRRYQRWNLKIS